VEGWKGFAPETLEGGGDIVVPSVTVGECGPRYHLLSQAYPIGSAQRIAFGPLASPAEPSRAAGRTLCTELTSPLMIRHSPNRSQPLEEVDSY
jgi:hypothetical protein